MKNYLSGLLFLIIFIKIVLATDDQTTIPTVKLGAYGLTAEKEVVFLQAQQNHILMLNAHFTPSAQDSSFLLIFLS
jgi:hypothetical protein